MKYQIQIKYTNPAHEHVTLRRRVESITRLVEATNEHEALNRATNQQRSLGFKIQEATVMKGPGEENRHVDDKASKKKKIIGGDNEKTDIATAGGGDVKEATGTASYPLLKPGQKLKPMKLKMGEGFDPEPSDIAAQLVKKHGKGKVTKDHVDAYERDRDSNKAIDKEAVMKHVQKMSEEVESINEGATRWEYSGTVNGKDYTITVPRGADLSDHLGHKKIQRENPHLEPHEVKAVADTSGEDEEHVEVEHEGKKYTHHVTNNQEPRMVYSEEVELDEAQKKLKPSYWKAEWRLGTQSEVDKNNKKIFDRLAKTDPVKAAAFHDNLMRMRKKDVDAVHKSMEKEMQKEEVELSEASKEGKDVMRGMRASLKSMDLRHGVDSDKREAGYKMSPAVKAAQAKSDALSKVVKRPQAGTLAAAKMRKEEVEKNTSKKARKAAEKMVNRAKGNANKVNVTPELELGKPNA